MAGGITDRETHSGLPLYQIVKHIFSTNVAATIKTCKKNNTVMKRS